MVERGQEAGIQSNRQRLLRFPFRPFYLNGGTRIVISKAAEPPPKILRSEFVPPPQCGARPSPHMGGAGTAQRGDTMKQKFNITGMTCSACSAHVEKAVSKMEGVRSAAVSLMTNSMVAEYDEGVVTAQDIIQAVTASGYGASLPQEKGKAAAPQKDDTMERELASMKRRLIWSFVFLIPLFYISMGHMMGAPLPAFLLGHENAVAFGLTQLLLTLPIMYLNDKYYKVGFKTLWHRAPNMDSLIAVGSIAAVIYGVFAIYQMAMDWATGIWSGWPATTWTCISSLLE